MLTTFFVFPLVCAAFLPFPAWAQQSPEPAQEVRITSSKDGSRQPALLYVPQGATATAKGPQVPLLVFLHSWSTNYKTAGGLDEALDEARRRGWVLVDPDFRGVNDHPDACASDLAVQDVLDSVSYAREHAPVDGQRICLLGSSGGGHMALMMVARAPKLWAVVSVWVPIADLAAWYQFSKSTNSQYYRMMDQCFGGPPGTPGRDKAYRHRSPLFILSRAKGVRISIDAGIHDGHGRNAVPLRNSLQAFNVLARANGFAGKALPEDDVELMTKEARIPGHLAGEKEPRRKNLWVPDGFEQRTSAWAGREDRIGGSRRLSFPSQFSFRTSLPRPANFRVADPLGFMVRWVVVAWRPL